MPPPPNNVSTDSHIINVRPAAVRVSPLCGLNKLQAEEGHESSRLEGVDSDAIRPMETLAFVGGGGRGAGVEDAGMGDSGSLRPQSLERVESKEEGFLAFSQVNGATHTYSPLITPFWFSQIMIWTWRSGHSKGTFVV